MTYLNTFILSDEAQLDAFARLRVSNPETIFDSKQIFDKQPLLWDELLESGSGISSSHSTNTASTTITSTASTAGKFTRQTYMRFNYQPGKSQLILMTGVLRNSDGGVGVYRRIGLFDDNNGIFIEDAEGTTNLVVRSKTSGSAVDTKIQQSSWNIDKFDGSGPSGYTIDFSKTQILLIDFEWLGVGRVRIGFVIDGIPHYAHQFLNANNLSVVYMSTPNLPLRYQLETSASSPQSSINAICSSVISEGGKQDIGVIRYKSTGGTHIDANVDGTIYAVVGLRLKSTHIGASIKIIDASIVELTNNESAEWIVILNPTIAGIVNWGDEVNSSVQTFIGSTSNTITNGMQIAGGYVQSQTGNSSEQLENAILIGSSINNTVDTLVLCVRPISSVNIDIEGSITWRELQ